MLQLLKNFEGARVDLYQVLNNNSKKKKYDLEKTLGKQSWYWDSLWEGINAGAAIWSLQLKQI